MMRTIYISCKTSLEDTKEKLEWRKRTFEFKQKLLYGIENLNDMSRIHDKEVNKISRQNLLHDRTNPPKRSKNFNGCYSPILNVCINNRKGRVKFKKLRIILYSGCSSMIIMGRPVEKLHPEKDDVVQWHTQAGNITTNIKVKVYFTLPELSTTNVVA